MCPLSFGMQAKTPAYIINQDQKFYKDNQKRYLQGNSWNHVQFFIIILNILPRNIIIVYASMGHGFMDYMVIFYPQKFGPLYCKNIIIATHAQELNL